jgi:hypothetical protein
MIQIDQVGSLLDSKAPHLNKSPYDGKRKIFRQLRIHPLSAVKRILWFFDPENMRADIDIQQTIDTGPSRVLLFPIKL